MFKYIASFVFFSLFVTSVSAEEIQVTYDQQSKSSDLSSAPDGDCEFLTLEDQKQILGFINEQHYDVDDQEIKVQKMPLIKGAGIESKKYRVIGKNKDSELYYVSYILEFPLDDVDLSEEHVTSLLEIAQELAANLNLQAKVNSLAYASTDNYVDSRRAALQRALAVRKILIGNDINPLSISVDAKEDMDNKNNKISISLEQVPNATDESGY